MTVIVGDNVVLNDGLTGCVRFIGEVEQRPGLYYGIELNSKKGNCRGIINGTKYFECKPSYGLFVTKGKISATRRMYIYRFYIYFNIAQII